MIFDAKIPDAGKLRLLADSASHADALKDCSKVEIESRGTLGEVSPTQSKKNHSESKQRVYFLKF